MYSNQKPVDETKIVQELKSKVKQEREITADIIERIREIDRNKIYLNYNHTSLFSFLTKEIGYTPAAAQRRIDAARLLNDIPELKSDLQSGSINLSQVAVVAQCLRQKKKDNQKVGIKAITTKEEKHKIFAQIKQQDLATTQKTVAMALDIKPVTFETKRTQQDDSVRVEMSLSKEQMKLLNRVKDLISHSNPNPTIAEIFELLANQFLDKKNPLKKKMPQRIDIKKNDSEENFNQNSKIERSSNQSLKCPKTTSTSSKQRASKNQFQSVALMRQKVFQRDQTCQWQNSRTGAKCNSSFQLQVDHKRAKWLGGEDKFENLQLLCAVHNKMKYEEEKLEVYSPMGK